MTDIDFDAVIAELRNGWQKAHPGDVGGKGPVCLIGAVARACGLARLPRDWETPETLAAAEVLAPVIHEHYPARFILTCPLDVLWEFNDNPLTTLDDVILVCEKARAAQGEIR